MARTFLRDSGVLYQARRIFTRNSGVLYSIRSIWTRNSGSLYKVFERGFTVVITAADTDITGSEVLAMFVAEGWDGVTAIDATLLLDDNDVRATSTGNAAIVIPAFPEGSTFTLGSSGTGKFKGKGGNGGAGGTTGLGSNGSAGGPAVSILMDIFVASAFMFGGGGGGAGGAGTSDSCVVGKLSDSCEQGGGGGGGGAGTGAGGTGVGSPSNSGNNGTNADSSANGSGGVSRTTDCCGNDHSSEAGADGGDWGEAGGNTAGRTGGAAGLAIQRNGFTVTFRSGNDSTHVKGSVS